MLLWRLLLVFTYQGRVRRYCSEPPLAFPWTDVSKAAQKGNGGSGSAWDISQCRQQARTTSQSFCLCQISVYFPVHSRICPHMHISVSPYTHAFVRVCIYILPSIYSILILLAIITEEPRVLHFIAFIILCVSWLFWQIFMQIGLTVDSRWLLLDCVLY